MTLRPLRKTVEEADGHKFTTIAGTEEESGEILRKLRERAARDGRSIGLVETWSETIRRPKVSKTLNENILGLFQPLLKVGYELGVYWLGENYSSHVTGMPIAQTVLGKHGPVEATFRCLPPTAAFSEWEIPSYYHAAALKVIDHKVWTSFRVFNVLECDLLLVDESDDFPNVQPSWMLLDPIRRRFVLGQGEKPEPIEGQKGTSIQWLRLGEGKTSVSIQYQGNEPLTVLVEMPVG